MASEKFKREYGQHLVDQVLKGQMTRRQLLVRASVFGFSMTAAGSLLAACGGTSATTTSASPAPAAAARRRRSWAARSTASSRRRSRTWTRSPSTTRAASSSSSRSPSTSSTSTTTTASSRSWPRAGRRNADASTCGPSSCARASSSTTAAPSRPPTWSPAWSASSTPRAAPAPSPPSQGILSPGGTKAVDTYTVQFNLDKPFADFPYLVCAVVVQHGHPAAHLQRQLREEARSAPAPSCSSRTSPSSRPSWSRTPPTGARTPQGHQLPYLDQVTWKSWSQDDVGRQPAAAVRRRRLPAADGVPGLAGAVRRRRTCASTSTPAPASARSPSTSRRTPWKSAPKELRQAVAYCLDRTAINQALYDGRSNLGYDTFWEPTVFPGSPHAARARAGLRQGQAAALRRRLRRAARPSS